jgi:thioredoxin 1
MAAVQEVTDSTFEELVLKSDKPVLVDYWADWCGPCKQVAPIIEELATSHGDKVNFVKMDTNENPVTPANNYVLGLPTIQLYVNGELVKAFKGAKSKSVLLGAIEEYL